MSKKAVAFIAKERKSQLKCFAIFLSIAAPVVLVSSFFPLRAPVFFLLNFLTGILCWTYLEYHLHRFRAHKKKGKKSRGKVYNSHLHHHKHPTEIKVTGVQRTVFFILSGLFFYLAVIWNNYFTLAAGFIAGLSYSFFSHWMLHKAWSRKLCPQLHRFHIHHHCKYPDRCFGFSTTLWDHVFRTLPPPEEKISSGIYSFYYKKSR